MDLILLVSKSTNPRDINEPAKAEITRVMLLLFKDADIKKTMVSATHIFAPDEIPSTKGPAIGLRKNVWSKSPDSASAPPSIITAILLGNLILKRIVEYVELEFFENNVLKISGKVILTLPIQTLSKKNKKIPSISIINATIHLIVFFLLICFS